MPTPKSLSKVFPAVLVHGAADPRPEPTQVPSLPALAEAVRELAMLKADYASTIEAQIAVEKTGKAPLELLGSRVVIEKKIVDAERKMIDLHRQQAQEAYAADADVWADLQRSRALCVLALRRINRTIDERKRSYRSGGQDAELPCGDDVLGFWLLGLDATRPGRTGLMARQYLVQCQSSGFISKQELQEDE